MPSGLKYCLLMVFLACFSGYGSAPSQPDTLAMQFKILHAGNGLSQGLVMGIARDPEGFMWFATGDGLNRYDGYQMKVYRHNPGDPFSLPENGLTGLEIDQNGNFWIATASHGLWRMDRRTERFTPFGNPGIGGGNIGRICILDGWMLVEGRGVAELLNLQRVRSNSTTCDGYRMKTPQIEEHFQLLRGGVVTSRNIRTGFITKWVRSGPELKRERTLFSVKTLSTQNHGNWLYDSRTNKLWVIADTKLYRCDENGNSTFQTRLPDSFHKKLLIFHSWDEEKFLIQVFPDGSHWLLDPNRKQLSRMVSNLPIRAPVTRIFRDKGGNSWIGTGGEGVAQWMAGSNKFQSWTRDKFVYQLVTSPKQEIVFSQQAETIWMDPARRTRKAVKFPAGKRLECMTPIVFSPGGTGWMPFTIDEKSTLLVPDDPAKSALVLPSMKGKSWSGEPVLYIDDRQYLWRIESGQNNRRFLRKTNLSRLEDDTVFLIPASPLLHSIPFVSAFHILGDHLWLGTTQGLFCFNLKTENWDKHHQKDKTDPASLSDNVVLSLCPDPEKPAQYLWVGTSDGGLNKMELATGRCRNFSVKDGLPNERIYSIQSDEFHNFWISTNKGLCCFTPPKTEKGMPVCRNFTAEDGLANDEFNRYSSTKLKDGTLVFGGTHGLTWFSPKEVLRREMPVPIALTGFSIFNSPVDFRSDSALVKAPFPFARQIFLRHDQDMFRIEFASLDFGPTSKKHYSYFLEGYDKKWIPGGSTNSATYTNLSPGAYTFRVKSTNSAGVPSAGEARVMILISPPWWGTWWFRSLAIFSFFGLIFGIYRYQLNQAIKVVNLRNRIALDLHDEIGSTLNSIAFFGEVANQMMAEDSQAKPVLERISTHSREVVESMSDIVWSLNSRNDSFIHLADRLQSFATHLLEPKGCSLEFRWPENPENIKPNMEQRRNLFLILKEAINNSAKYAEASRFWIHVFFQANELKIEIGDNGKGFDPSIESTGNGLESMQNRARYLGAVWKVESRPMEGTRVTLTFKI